MKYVRMKELAEYFSISVPTVRLWQRQGKIPKDTYIKVSGSYRFDLAAVERAFKAENADTDDEIDTPEDTGTVEDPVEQVVALWEENESPDEDL